MTINTHESKYIISKGDMLLNALYLCFDCGSGPYKGYAESASYFSTCRECAIGMLIVVELNGEKVNGGYFGNN